MAILRVDIEQRSRPPPGGYPVDIRVPAPVLDGSLDSNGRCYITYDYPPGSGQAWPLAADWRRLAGGRIMRRRTETT